MRFFKSALTVALGFLAIPSLAAITPAQLIGDLEGMTADIKIIESSAAQINTANSLLLVIGGGPFPKIISGVTQVVDTTVSTSVLLKDQPPYTVEADAKAIANAFHAFVEEQITLLNILPSKTGLLGTILFGGAPIASPLFNLKLQVDIFAYCLIATIPEGEARNLIMADQVRIRAKLQLSINAHVGLRIVHRRHARDLIGQTVE
ncbi:hypothetical protein AA313_de0206307 [Arthrobotrys entomopaga]|nr:hypothetical protein AA313_de0206307 [Arthrobotrys entomopaga]